MSNQNISGNGNPNRYVITAQMEQPEKKSAFDREAVVNSDGRVDHAASKAANIVAAKKQLKEAVPGEVFEQVFTKLGGLSLVAMALFPITVPVVIAIELLQIVTKPMGAVKDTVDAAFHGAAALFQRKH